MKLKSMAATNYRTLKSITIPFEGEYCTISGRNNAGKSGVIRLITSLLAPDSSEPFNYGQDTLDYSEDKTQWVKDQKPIRISYEFELSPEDDPALLSFLEKISARSLSEQSVLLKLIRIANVEGGTDVEAEINQLPVDTKTAVEIEKRLRSSNLLFVHNSTLRNDDIYFAGGRRRSFFDFVISSGERRTLEAANKTIEKQIKKLARDHVEGLTEILEKLSDQYSVELSPPEGFSTRRMPLSINIRDKSVQVPINDWGSGTQNRTHILMAILRANRMRRTASANDKITSLVIIEEPESFLHPSAQAEFGRLLRHLASQFGIQIIVTTHSPYMLNQEQPASNILLSRKNMKNKLSDTMVVQTSGTEWMAPFADHLGIKQTEFQNLRSIFSADQSKILLVEGPIDVEYFSFLKSNTLKCEKLSGDIEISPYGGKDTLKNTVLLQFVLAKFDRVYVTYDLDAKEECCTALARAGVEDNFHAALGMKASGKDCIEGLLPIRVLAAVNGRETDLVMALGGAGKER